MHVIRARNVREALPLGLAYLSARGQVEKSRAGDVMVAPEPVTTVYERPRERVLLSPVRDANPFFHLAEAVWMLAGRRDAKFLDEYVGDFSKRFAEPDGVMHGAYGRRWRRTFGFDQLDAVVEKLQINHSDRQAVIVMWDATLPHEGHYAEEKRASSSSREEFGEGDLLRAVRDRPCNTHVYLRVRNIEDYTPASPSNDTPSQEFRDVLDITVCCRSNDMLMGGYGANAVHFSVLQEYLACRIGVGVGTYYQISNNFHVYLKDVRAMVRRVDQRLGLAEPQIMLDMLARNVTDAYPLDSSSVTKPLFSAPDVLESEIRELSDYVDRLHRWEGVSDLGEFTGRMQWRNSELCDTVWNALAAHRCRRVGNKEMMTVFLAGIGATDWRRACVEWVARRS
jgi:thymidylate synthase